jgi:hypothetical protein
MACAICTAVAATVQSGRGCVYCGSVLEELVAYHFLFLAYCSTETDGRVTVELGQVVSYLQLTSLMRRHGRSSEGQFLHGRSVGETTVA